MSAAEVAVAPAVSRAEARRRRILENSAARLARITGREHEVPAEDKECCQGVPIVSATNEVDEAFPFQTNHVRLQDEPAEVYEDLRDSRGSPVVLASKAKETSVCSTLLDTRLHIPIICILFQAIYATNGVVDGYLFFPLAMWELVEFFFFESGEESSSMSSMAFLLPVLGLTSNKHVALLKTCKKLSRFVEDTFFYLFTAVVIRSFSDCFETSR